MTWIQEENNRLMDEGYFFWSRFLILVLMGVIVLFGFWVIFLPDIDRRKQEMYGT